MAQSILCPQCEKRFKLSDKPPAQATCSGCGTLMDLTAFGGGEQPAKAAAPQPTAPTSASPKPHPQRASRAGARRRRRPPPRAGARGGPHGRGREAPPQPPMSGGTQAILIFVGVLILVLIVVVAGKQDADDVPTKPAVPVADDPPDEPYRSYVPEPTADKKDEPPPRQRKVPLGRKGLPRLGRVQLSTHPWPEDIDAATRAKVDEAIRKMYVGGRDGVEASDWLVTRGRPICGRLISEFHAIEGSPGFDNREGASMAMAIDGTLRRIDGQIERYWKERERIRAWGTFGGVSFITRIAKRWTWWWIDDEWKLHPREPWDPFEDESDATADGMKPVETKAEKDAKKKKKKKKGYGKRAGADD